MTPIPDHPTPYAAVNALVNELLPAVQRILGDQHVGMYLAGSLAGGDFALDRSDIDFVAVTEGKLSRAVLSALAAMHAGISGSGLEYVDRLEGVYMPRRAIRRYDPGDACHPTLKKRGRFGMDEYGMDWILKCKVLREKGITLAGPSPESLIDPIGPDQLRQASAVTLHSFWMPRLDDPGRLRERSYQSFAILTMCRDLYTLKTGRIASKKTAARWALENGLEEEWRPVVERALAWPAEPQPDHLEEALRLIRHTGAVGRAVLDAL